MNHFGIDATGGAVVSDVRSGSPAQRAGLKPGDLITAVDGKSVVTSGQLRNAIGSKPPATKIRVSFVREGKNFEASEVLDQPNPAPVKTARAATPAAAKGPSAGPLAGMK